MEDPYLDDPCPWNIVNNCGCCFTVGVMGSSLFDYANGISFEQMKKRVPIMGGKFGAWGICFATFQCTLAQIRHKEDPWNLIMSGAATGFFMSVKSGPTHMVLRAAIGAVLLGIAEGICIKVGRDESKELRLAGYTRPKEKQHYYRRLAFNKNELNDEMCQAVKLQHTNETNNN